MIPGQYSLLNTINVLGSKNTDLEHMMISKLLLGAVFIVIKFLLKIYLIKKDASQEVVAHIFKPSPWQAKAGESL